MAVPTTNGFLMVPIRLDALLSQDGHAALRPFVDFSNLPYLNKKENGFVSVNYDQPYTSETALIDPFVNEGNFLEKGMHLHWTLPDALTKARKRKDPNFRDANGRKDSTAFQPVPDRWLVLRFRDNNLEKKWMVMSDFLWPEDTDLLNPNHFNPNGDVQKPQVTFHHKTPEKPGDRPFCYQGRVESFKDKWTPPDKINSIKDLTAVGFGDTLYAAFYPNCRGVFGIHDKDITNLEQVNGVTYAVCGWYSDDKKNDDPLRYFINSFGPGTERMDTEDWLKTLNTEYGWTLPEGQNKSLPTQLLCYAKYTFVPTKNADLPDFNDTKIAIANSGTEAVSAFLAHEMSGSPEERKRIENQLESLHLSDFLQKHSTDIGPMFEEARHTKSFKPVSGGRLWAFRPETAQAAEQDQLADLHRDEALSTLFLPPGVEQRLAEINTWQKFYNQGMEGQRNLQQRIFTGWQKYMRTVYHHPSENYLSGTNIPAFPKIDDARKHIEKKIVLLNFKATLIGSLKEEEEEGPVAGKNAKATEAPDLSMADPSGLLHFIPESRPEFRGFLESLMEKSNKGDNVANKPIKLPSQADNIKNLTTSITKDLSIRAAVITEARSRLSILSDKKRSFIFSDLESVAAETDRFFDIALGNAVRPEAPAAADKLKALKNGSLPEAEKVTAAQKILAGIIKAWATLPLLHLEAIPAPRYWQPTEPVLLLSGNIVQGSDRHGMDNKNGLLVCKIQEIDRDELNVSNEKSVSILTKFLQDADTGAETLHNGNPWNPVFFEWEVRIDALDNKDKDTNIGLNNLENSRLAYHEDFITAQYNLDETRSEFNILQTGDTNPGADFLRGRSVLTPFAGGKLSMEINNYLVKIARNFSQLPKADPPAPDDLLKISSGDPEYQQKWLDYFNTAKDKIIKWELEDHLIKVSMIFSKLPGSKKPDGIDPNNLTTDEWLAYFDKHAEAIDKHFKNNGEGQSDKSGRDSFAETMPLSTVLEVQDKLKNLPLQSQALSGFNNGLLMQHQTLQMEIAEPNGFEEYKAFSQKVREAVGRQNNVAVLPDVDFHPLRTGKMELYRLRVVDNFGRYAWVGDQTVHDKAFPKEGIRTPWYMETKNGVSTGVILPPRITQPSRLNFRWKSAAKANAGENAIEANSHPATSPICGWVVPNNLDNSLMIYSAEGTALGAIDSVGEFQFPPGKNEHEEIKNSALRRLKEWLVDQAKQNKSFIGHFILDLDDIMEGIDPESFAQHQARMLLMGRPIALVQASVNLELKGWPAVHHEMYWFKQTVEQDFPYKDDGFPNVKIPVRIGEQKRLNSGVVVYWLDSEAGFTENFYRSPFGKRKEHEAGNFEKEELTFHQSINAPAQDMAILMDPRGLLHCTTGILPTKTLSIPPEHFTAALQRIQVTFLTAPLLSAPRHIDLSLPVEPGFNWTWIQRDELTWSELTQRPVIRKTDFQAAFPADGETNWQLLITKGWMEPLPNQTDLAFLLPTRKEPALFPAATPEQKALQDEIENQLNRLELGILPTTSDARFGPTAEIREGWLSLRPAILQEP